MSDPKRPPLPGGGDSDMHPAARALFGWVTSRWTGQTILYGLITLSLGLVLTDLVHHRHVEDDVEKLMGFYGLYGFVAFGFAVLMGKPLGWLLRRDEDYYGDADDSDGGGL